MATPPKHDTQTIRIVTLDFNGGSHVYRNSELGMNIPVRIAPSGISAERARFIAEALNRNCADSHVRFEAGATLSENTSAVHIGYTDAFDRFGRFLGLAEGIGSGDAFVLLDDSANDAELVDVIRHEAGHILGTLDHGGAGLARYAYNITTHSYDYTTLENGEGKYTRKVETRNRTFSRVSPPSGLDELNLEYDESSTSVRYVYDNYDLEMGHDSTEYDTLSFTATGYVEATSISAGTVSIAGGSATDCTAQVMSVTGKVIYDSVLYKKYDYYDFNTPYDASYSNYRYYQGGAFNCTVGGQLTVAGNAVAKSCTVGGLNVGSRDSNYTGTRPLAENCTVNSGTLTVTSGGDVKNCILNNGKAVIGVADDWEKEHHWAENGDAVVTNLVVNGGSVDVGLGGELHNAKIDGTLRIGDDKAKLTGTITCNNVYITSPFAGAITIKLDLRDFAVANKTDTFRNDRGDIVKKVEYFANYTTRTTEYIYTYEPHPNYPNIEIISSTTSTVSYGTFDNKDRRFYDIDQWEYTFYANIGSVYDPRAFSCITVDFGGTEKAFDSGVIQMKNHNYEDIPFNLNSDPRKWVVSKAESLGGYDPQSEAVWGEAYPFYTLYTYNPTLHGETADVLWLEYGVDEDAEYTVELPSDAMSGTMTEVSVSGDGGMSVNIDVKNSELIIKGGASTGNFTVSAEDTEKQDHECDLELIVVPEEVPVIGKLGAKKYADMLKRAQKNHVSTISDILPNVHTKLFKMAFDLTNMGASLTVDWTELTMELKLQGKMEWTLGKGTAGTGKNLKLVVDLSGDENYISIFGDRSSYSWDIVGEIKVPDFKIGKFKFSNMVLKVNKGESTFSASAYVQLPWIKYSFGGSIGIVDGYLDSMAIGVDNLNIPLGSTGLFLQKIEGGVKGIATELALTFEGTLGLTAGPQISVDFVDWLGIDAGEYALCEMTLTGTISTDGDLEGKSNCVILGGLATGGGSAAIKGGELTVTGTYTFLNGNISIKGELHAGTGGITISGTGTATVPREKYFGALAGLSMSANVMAAVHQSASDSYVMAWQTITVLGNEYTIGFRSTFEGEVSLLGATDQLGDIDVPIKSVSQKSSVKSFSVAEAQRGETTLSSSKTISVNYSGLSLFQFNLSRNAANVSLTFDGTEYTQAAIAAGLYENMQVVSELTSGTCITIAVNNAASGDWTMNAYGDASASFGVYAVDGGAQKPVVTVTVGDAGRSATIGYTLGDLSGLTNVQLSIFRTEKDAGYTGQRLAVIGKPAAEGSYEWIMDQEAAGGEYSFYLMLESDGQTPVYSDISAASAFLNIDTEAPDRIQVVTSEWKSTGTVISWEEPWDNQGVAGYKIRYTTGDGDMAEVDVKTNSFTFDKVPNGTYDFQVAAYDAAGNLSAWSEQQSCLVLTVANAKYKDATLTEDLELAEYESAVNITGGDFAVTAAANSLFSGSTLGNAEISGIVENSIVNGTADLAAGAQGYGLTVNGELSVGVNSGVPEPENPFTEEAVAENAIASAAVEDVTVSSGGKLTLGNYAKANGITVASGGSVVIQGDAQVSGLSVDYGATLTVTGDGKYRLADDIRVGGKLNTIRTITGNGHKIIFEQYKQSAEYRDSSPDNDLVLDEIAFTSEMDNLTGKALAIEIDSNVYGDFKIASKAGSFDGTITVIDHADQSSAVVGFDTFMLVGNALCKLYRSYDNELWLQTTRSEIDPPAITVVQADSDAYDTVVITATSPESVERVTQYSYRYSRNADMSDAVTGVSDYSSFGLSKYDLEDNATYYIQVSIENEYGVKSLWSDAASFTVVPKLLPAAPTLSVTGATNKNSQTISFNATDTTGNSNSIREYRFRYADNPEMENAIVIATGQRLINYASIQKSGIEDGKDYYVQAGVKHGNDWSYWSEAVVINTQGWDLDGITVGPEPDGDVNYYTLGGKRAKNVTVIDGGYFYGGGDVDGLTVEAGGFFRDDNSDVTHAVVNGGSYWLDEGSVTDIVVNGGKLRLMGGTLKGTTVIGANAVMDLDGLQREPNLSGTILIQGQFTIYYLHPVISTNAEFVFDIGAHEAEALRDKSFVEYVFVLGGASKFTAQLDDTPEIGDYRITSLYQVPAGELYVALDANDGTKLGTMRIGDAPILYNGLYYSLIDQKDVAYLHVSDNQDPPFIGPVKLSKNGAIYDSDISYDAITVSSSSECDHMLIEQKGQVYAITVGDGGSVDAFGIVFGATVDAGGVLTLKEGSIADSHNIVIQKGGTVVIEGGRVTSSTDFDIAGTLTVNGIFNSYEQDSGEWGPHMHWFKFRLDQLDAPSDSIMISNFANLQCNAMFSVYVGANQTNVSYKLMGGAANFNSYLALHVEGRDIQEYLYLGGDCLIGDSYYSLAVVDNVLTLTVSASRPVHAPSVWADVTEPTTGSVTVTASFDETAKTKEYSLDGTTWKTYSKAVRFTSNGIVYFRGKDSKGNTSPVVSYEVTNIQKSGPEPGPGPDLPTDDDTANSWLYDKTKGVNEELRYSYGTTLEDGVSEVQMDTNSVSEVISGVTYSNFVGQGDEADFSKVVLDHGARLSFALEATDAVKFIVYSLVEGTGKKAGTYTLKVLQTTAFKPAKGAESAQKNTKQLSLDPGEYYISMQSTNAKKGGSAFYNVSINEDGTNGSVFYPQGNNEDDWTDMKTEGAGSAMLDDLGMVTPETTDLIDDWVGFGDTVDYKRFMLEHAAELDFAFGAPDGSVKFTVCKLKETTKKDVTTYSLINIKTATIKANQASARLNDLRLEAGEYFIKAEYTNAKKGNGTDYTVSISDSRFYSDGDSGDNNWLYDKKTKEVNISVMDGFVSEIDTDHIGELLIDEPDTVIYDGIAGYEFHNFVGFGDEADYAKISVAHPGTATFKVTATDAAKLVVYQLTYNKKGEVSGTKAIQTVTLKKNAAGLFETPTNTKACNFKQPGDYYISVQATAKKKETTYYNVSLVSTDIAAPLLVNQSAQDMCALTGLEDNTSLGFAETCAGSASSLVMSDSLSFGQYDTDALAGTYLDSVQDKLLGETGNGLLASL